MNFVVEADQTQYPTVPVGSYPAQLVEIKEVPPSAQHPDWGPGLAWEFQVLEGPHKGGRVSAFTGRKATTGNNLGRLLRQMLGRAINQGEGIDGTALKARAYQIVCDLNKTGQRTKVISATPLAGYTMPANVAAPAASAPPAARQAWVAQQGVPPRPQMSPAMPASTPSAPAAPAAPVVQANAPRVAERSMDLHQDEVLAWVAMSDGAEPAQMVLGDLRGRIKGGLSSAGIKVFDPETQQWTPWAAADLPW